MTFPVFTFPSPRFFEDLPLHSSGLLRISVVLPVNVGSGLGIFAPEPDDDSHDQYETTEVD